MKQHILALLLLLPLLADRDKVQGDQICFMVSASASPSPSSDRQHHIQRSENAGDAVMQ